MNDNEREEAIRQQAQLQQARFELARTWADGLNLKLAGVDLVAPMIYNLMSNLNMLAAQQAQVQTEAEVGHGR